METGTTTCWSLLGCYNFLLSLGLVSIFHNLSSSLSCLYSISLLWHTCVPVTLLLQRLLAERSQEAVCHQKPCRRFAVTLRKEKKILNPFIALTGTLVNHSGNERRRCWCGTNLFFSEFFPQWCCMWGYFRQKNNMQKHFTVAFALLLSCIS